MAFFGAEKTSNKQQTGEISLSDLVNFPYTLDHLFRGERMTRFKYIFGFFQISTIHSP